MSVNNKSTKVKHTSIEGVTVQGARVHNLKNVDVFIPRDSLTVITGLSGSGKSSLAFDTIYAEGRRRYVETLSPYARQFLGGIEKPEVDLIEGLSPAISIEQKTISGSPRSTVGTVTEVYDFLRLLFARVGVQHCTNCGLPVVRQTIEQIIDNIYEKYSLQKISVLAPIVRGRKGHYQELFEKISKDGFTRVRCDKEFKEIIPEMKLDRYKIHSIEIVIDRIDVKEESKSRLYNSIETALKYGEGSIVITVWDNMLIPDDIYSEKNSCPNCNISFEEPEPNSFSFNTPYGYCSTCQGLGELSGFIEGKIIPNKNLSLNEEAIAPLGKPDRTPNWAQIEGIAKHFGYDSNTPLNLWSDDALNILFYGDKKERFETTITYANGRTQIYQMKFEGLLKMLDKYFSETKNSAWKERLSAFMNTEVCRDCFGSRLKPESLAVKIDNNNIFDICKCSLSDASQIINNLVLSSRQMQIGRLILKEINDRISFLLEVGLHYLSLNRSAKTLSGGESQRIRLATQIGSQLSGVMYVLDEPSIGLHQHDNAKLILSLKKLRDIGNTVIVVEHDKEMIESGDYIIDIGPRAGVNGGKIVAEANTLDYLNYVKERKLNSKSINSKDKSKSNKLSKDSTKIIYGNNILYSDNLDSLTLAYLSGTKIIAIPKDRRVGNGKEIVLYNATGNNLKDITLKLPLGKFICITGMSGSGKSTLMNRTLYPILSKHFYDSVTVPMPYSKIEGLEFIDKVIEIDQSPIGRTPRSNTATYTGLFTLIRDLFAQLQESKIRGYKQGRFSFNVAGGRCNECEGAGMKTIEMNFLPDVFVTCEFCNGKRYNRETLEVHFKGKSISDILEMTVDEAVIFFQDIPKIQRKVQTLQNVGLGYIKVGQQAPTLSGGEAQRVKLATELSKVQTGKTFYILDEPTTGLHFEDVNMLLKVLQSLTDKGNTVVVIEHNLDVIKCADWVIDLGPEGGKYGGEIVVEGTPEDIINSTKSLTAKYLKKELIPD